MAKNCIIVNRVSSAEQKDGYSLDAQSRHGTKYAKENGLEPIREFTFQESASKQNENKQFDAVMNFIFAQIGTGRIPLHVVVEKKDRWGRLHSRKEIIQHPVLDGKVVVHYYREGQVLDKTCSPEDIFIDDVVTSMNKYVAMNIGRKAKMGMLEKARQGWLPHKPPPGYLNNPDKESPLAIIVNEGERRFILRMFELRGEDGYSYGAIHSKLLEEGVVPPYIRPRFHKSTVEKILKNPFYNRKVVWDGQVFEGRQERIVSAELFRKVEETFSTSGRRLRVKDDGVFADFLRCGSDDCGCKITYHQKSKPSGKTYHLYVCANGKKKHKTLQGMYMNENEVFAGFESAVDDISINDDMAQAVADALNENHGHLQRRLKKEEETYRKALKTLESREDNLYEDLGRGRLTEAMYKRKIEDIRRERDRFTDLILEIEGSANDTYLHTAKEILELAKDAKRLWKTRNRHERAEFLKKVLWNPRITGRTIEYEMRKPCGVVAKMKATERWGSGQGSNLENCPHPAIPIEIPFSSYQWFADKDFLYQEYVTKGKSMGQIARDVGCCRSSISKYMFEYDIPVRCIEETNYRKKQMAYGEKIFNGRVVPHLGEQKVIDKMKELRAAGNSYGKIATWLNAQAIPTKNGKSPWDRKTVHTILQRGVAETLSER